MANLAEDTVIISDQREETHFPLWINDEWYIPVNAEGQCVGICGEGALGFIIQLFSTERTESVRALKIPRLMAETNRENAYISELLSQELRSVKRIFDEPGSKIGLLQALDTSSPLQTPLTIHRLAEAKEWDGSLILVRFQKGENPYFCLVKPGKTHSFYPPKATVPEISLEQFTDLETSAMMQEPGKKPKGWSRMVFLEQGQDHTAAEGEPEDNAAPPEKLAKAKRPQFIRIFNVDGALSPEKEREITTWYTCIPSIVYSWAPNTLQEAIGLSTRGASWSIDDHLQLAENICNGIKVLHDKHMLHADIRPANIVYLGEPKKPANFFLSDYGSFAVTNVQPAQRRSLESSDITYLGPVIGGERISVFYAPERKVGREREDADTAIVVNPGENSDSYYVLVGWKSEFEKLNLLDKRMKPNKTREEYVNKIHDYRKQAESRGKGTYDDILDKGDRIQLRDYVFELAAKEQVLDNMQIFECRKLYWTIYHGRIMINENKMFEDCYAFPIPRVIELLQWSAATDLFGLGVLCLYSVYSDYRDNPANLSNSPARVSYQPDREVDANDENFSNTIGEQDNDEEYSHNDEIVQDGDGISSTRMTTAQTESAVDKKVDEGFEAMITYLADKSLFNAIWPKLEWLRNQIETKLQQEDWTAERLARENFEKNLELETDNDEENGEEKTLKTEALEVVSQITATVPGIERLLQPLAEKDIKSAEQKIEYQLGPFIFYIHFVLRCLHREEDLEAEPAWKKVWMTEPFCKNRHDLPETEAISRALDRLMEIRGLIKKPMLRGLKTEASNISQFDLRSETQLRGDLRKMNDEKQKWETERIDWKTKTSRLEADNIKFQEKVNDLESKSARLTQELNSLQPKIQTLQEEVDAIKLGREEAIKLLNNVSYRELLMNKGKVIEDIKRKFHEALIAPPRQPGVQWDEGNNEHDNKKDQMAV